MDSASPRVSVIIPAYNQANYLSSAISSALGQTYRDFEIIVIDDGSTDNTPAVAQSFCSSIRYIRQQNRGLAAARNTGIRQTRGEYVALLDSDDMWQPNYLETIVRMAEDHRSCSAYYCGWRYVDVCGHELPQAPTQRVVPPSMLYPVLLRANFLVPSAVSFRRSACLGAGLFDESFRRVEDWHLWLRMLREGYSFAGCPDCLVDYRLHGNTLSTDVGAMQRAVLSMVSSLFGPDDGCSNNWSEEKRRAYGGGYRYAALTSLIRGEDWSGCVPHFKRALQVDPSLSSDLDLFYELALGPQPLGHRGTADFLDLRLNASSLRMVLDRALTDRSALLTSETRCRSYWTAYYALGLVAYNTGHSTMARSFLLSSVRFWPKSLLDPRFVNALLRSCLGRGVTTRVRSMRQKAGWSAASRPLRPPAGTLHSDPAVMEK